MSGIQHSRSIDNFFQNFQRDFKCEFSVDGGHIVNAKKKSNNMIQCEPVIVSRALCHRRCQIDKSIRVEVMYVYSITWIWFNLTPPLVSVCNMIGGLSACNCHCMHRRSVLLV